MNAITAIRALIVVLGLAAWYGTQYLIGAKRPLPADEAAKAGSLLTDGDVLLRLTAPINQYLNRRAQAANALLIASSAIIDVLGLFVIVYARRRREFLRRDIDRHLRRSPRRRLPPRSRRPPTLANAAQKQMADWFPVAQNTYEYWENGKNQPKDLTQNNLVDFNYEKVFYNSNCHETLLA